MEFDANGFRKRREHRIREINEKMDGMKNAGQESRTHLESKSEQGSPTVQTSSFSQTINIRSNSRRIRRFRLQVLVSILLLVFVVALDQSDLEWWGVEAREFTREALTQDYNFAGTSAWFEQTFGQFPSLLPTVQLFKPKDVVPVLSPPLTGKIVESFSPALTGVIIETGVSEEVHPIGPGWVRTVEKKKGMGTIVVIQHADALESTYGFLGKAFVKKNDWVYPDTIIGVVGEQSLFLQVRDKKAFVDPLDVVPFE